MRCDWCESSDKFFWNKITRYCVKAASVRKFGVPGFEIDNVGSYHLENSITLDILVIILLHLLVACAMIIVILTLCIVEVFVDILESAKFSLRMDGWVCPGPSIWGSHVPHFHL